MSDTKSRRFPTIALAFAYLILIVVLAAGFGRVTKSQHPKIPVNVENRTSSLEVTKAEIEPDGRSIRLAVKNTTRKNIDWFRISLGQDLAIEADFAFADENTLAPNQSYEDSYPFSAGLEKLDLIVLCVVFDDASSDGNAKIAEKAVNKRLGQQMELRRLLPLLNQAANSPNQPDESFALNGLEKQISALEDPDKTSLPDDVRTGVKLARGRVLSEIASIKQSGRRSQDMQQDLVKLRTKYARINTNLEKYKR
jgi:hypothetical protein